jgi:hypothetical protein
MASNSGVTDLAAILDAKWSLARERTEAIRPLIERQSFDRAAVMRRAVECGVHTATLYRWLDRYRRNATLGSLLPRTPGAPKGARRISDRADRMIAEVVEGRYRMLLASFERLIPLRKPSQLAGETLSKKLLALSEGTIGELSTLLNRAAAHAIRTGRERIDLEALTKTNYIPPSERRKRTEQLVNAIG